MPSPPLALYHDNAHPAWARDYSCPLHLRSTIGHRRRQHFYYVEVLSTIAPVWCAVFLDTSHGKCSAYIAAHGDPSRTYRITHCSPRRHRINCRRHGLIA
jgi:hypothetical protein